jgi:NADH-quinone oxidoreductase subunit J
MADFLFYLFATITLVSALVMVASRSAVNAAVAMIVCFVITAALFVMLEAYFLAALQVLVYAGAVMVLFLFIIMLIDTDLMESVWKGRLTNAASVIGAALVLTFAGVLLLQMDALPAVELTEAAAVPEGTEGGFAFTTAAKTFGYSLYTKYLLPFQVAGFLLLVAMIGVIVISKKSAEEKAAATAAKAEGGAQ